MRRNPKALKAAKQKRMRSAYLKPYDISAYIKIKSRPKGTPASMDGIPEDQIPYFNYRKRGNTFWDPYLEAKYPSRGMISDPRRAALAAANREHVMKTLDEWSQLVLEEMNVVMHRGGITKTVTRLFWSSDERYCFFTKEDYREKVIFKSIPFHGEGCKDRAKFALANNQIDWIEKCDLSGLVEPDPPSG